MSLSKPDVAPWEKYDLIAREAEITIMLAEMELEPELRYLSEAMHRPCLRPEIQRQIAIMREMASKDNNYKPKNTQIKKAT